MAGTRLRIEFWPPGRTRRPVLTRGQSVQVDVFADDDAFAPVTVADLVVVATPPDGLVRDLAPLTVVAIGHYRAFVTGDQDGLWDVEATCTGPFPAATSAAFRIQQARAPAGGGGGLGLLDEDFTLDESELA